MSRTEVTQDDHRDGLLGEVADEYLQQLDQGERPDIERYAQRHPEIASLIRQTFPALQLVNDSLPESNRGEGLDLSGSKQLGDFRLLHELGSGGMGFVYEAVQISMGRHVALKILPMAGALQQKQLQRFRNEVRAAAMLDHPHIVSVYSVGEERGVHFYAMQLIRGQSLAEVIGELLRGRDGGGPLTGESIHQLLSSSGGRSAGARADAMTDEPSSRSGDSGASGPTVPASETRPAVKVNISTAPDTSGDQEFFRSVARLGIQAADALQHAHDLGVLHRDIKPGNLMLDADALLHVTDFGLAHIEGDAGMTLTGDILGTLRYMSPEQASADRVVIDHRSDIYSFGVTFYELLALQPAFAGNDRQSLLHQIAFEEPKPLRHFNRAVPQDLQTIVHKALSKNRDDRYQSAQELADDLSAFVDDEPIKARPLSLMQRLTRWSAKRKGLVAAVSGTLILAVIGLSISNAMIAQERNVSQEAEQNERAERVEAGRQRKLADASAKMARETVDKYLTKVSEDELLNAPSMQPLRKELLELALNYYQKFIQQRPDDAELQAELANAFSRVGLITLTLGQHDVSQDAYEQAMKIQRNLVDQDPDRIDGWIELSETYAGLSRVFDQRGSIDKATELQQDCLDIRKRLESEHPKRIDLKDKLAQSLNGLSHLFHKVGSVKESIQLQQDILKVMRQLVDAKPNTLKYQEHLALTYQNVAFLTANEGNASEALKLYLKAVAIQDEMCDRNPKVLEYRQHLARTYGNLAQVHSDMENDDEAIEMFEASLELRRELAENNPSVVEYQRSYALACNNLAAAWEENGDNEKAISLYAISMGRYRALVDSHPEVHEHHAGLALAYHNTADLHESMSDSIEAERMYREAVKINQELVIHNPRHIDYQDSLALSYHDLALLILEDSDRLGEAQEFLVEALKIRKNLASAHPESEDFEDSLLQTLRNTADSFSMQERYEQALKYYWELNSVAKALSEQTPNRLDLQARIVNSYDRIVQIHLRRGQPDKALSIYEPLTALETEHIAHPPTFDGGGGASSLDRLFRNPPTSMFQQRFVRTQNRFGSLFDRVRQYEKALNCFLRSIEMCEQLSSEQDDNPGQQRQLTIALIGAARIHRVKQEPQLIQPTCQRAIAIIEAIPIETRSSADWVRLGRAHFYLEQWKEARDSLEQGIEKRGEQIPSVEEGPRWWYLTMSLARLGEKEKGQLLLDALLPQLGGNNQPYDVAWYQAETTRLLAQPNTPDR